MTKFSFIQRICLIMFSEGFIVMLLEFSPQFQTSAFVSSRCRSCRLRQTIRSFWWPLFVRTAFWLILLNFGVKILQIASRWRFFIAVCVVNNWGKGQRRIGLAFLRLRWANVNCWTWGWGCWRKSVTNCSRNIVQKNDYIIKNTKRVFF